MEIKNLTLVRKLKYNLVRSKRRKTSEIIVDENEITLRIPFDKSINDADKLVASKIKWIIRKQKEYREREPEIAKPKFLQGSTLPYLGKNYQILIVKNGKHDYNKIKLENDKFIFTLVNTNATMLSNKLNLVKSLYEDWLYAQASKIFEEKTEHFRKVVNVSPQEVVVKKLKNRWGSATGKRTINLNLNLIKAPEDVIDYVIIHELCHLIIKKHSHHFWNLLKKYVDDYKARIEWLEVNGRYLI